ncbi:hypothetical protein EMIHUDRAFT_243257 [Emiliania huxleyi CCMP1516]|uniref:Uncharacterized protein n=2 Tax=Emiliania huxleyi TaxID=2903 RepID=A0A0D3J6K1_EMIH1|nr:hypothetical protein EMIHUDRAFT_243257 [Emiliania huxleyi CCMP1516]EOD19136.1 hypothetical protein EMIHUDRAFT_243257 [Emiliania huxleyi CCMP1516]|eukprot:XP_005771565.1 hypothetical protein EMIHUDRAFT_243257 [Emiliania huxleyi CCMP1516]
MSVSLKNSLPVHSAPKSTSVGFRAKLDLNSSHSKSTCESIFGPPEVHAAFRATNSAATAKWRWTCSHVADAAPEWPALLAATTTATLILRADPSYPTVALFHVSLTLRKILKRRAAESPTSRTLWTL